MTLPVPISIPKWLKIIKATTLYYLLQMYNFNFKKKYDNKIRKHKDSIYTICIIRNYVS